MNKTTKKKYVRVANQILKARNTPYRIIELLDDMRFTFRYRKGAEFEHWNSIQFSSMTLDELLRNRFPILKQKEKNCAPAVYTWRR